MRLWDLRLRWMKNALCVSFATALLVLSSRTAVNCIATLVLSSTHALGQTSARPPGTRAVDRKPKPTRQQERTSIACMIQLKWLAFAKDATPAEPVWRTGASVPSLPAKNWSSGFAGIEATKPAYLRASDTVSQSPLPPPAAAGSAFA
ncbi:MAG TPA: hypothetical protein VKU80_18240 [Planctomycetota bacterium]|nr:hypothetical protein [Planctomycetota bacterium]